MGLLGPRAARFQLRFIPTHVSNQPLHSLRGGHETNFFLGNGVDKGLDQRPKSTKYKGWIADIGTVHPFRIMVLQDIQGPFRGAHGWCLAQSESIVIDNDANLAVGMVVSRRTGDCLFQLKD